jgi:hypothetical protein
MLIMHIAWRLVFSPVNSDESRDILRKLKASKSERKIKK